MDSYKESLARIIDKNIESGNDEAFYMLDIEDMNIDNRVIKTLANLGTGFDCASLEELKKVLQLRIDPERIIFAHTVKKISHLKFASDESDCRQPRGAFEDQRVSSRCQSCFKNSLRRR